MSVGALREAAFRNRCQSNSPTRRRRFVVEVFSVFRSSRRGRSDLRAISAHDSSFAIGPEVPPLGLWTRIGYVRHTMTTRRTRDGAIPASARQPLAVVSREVT